jgi:hypothetical protein
MAEYSRHARRLYSAWHWHGGLQAYSHFGTMNRKQLAILVALVVVIGGISVLTLKDTRSNWSSRESNSGDRVVADFPVNDVNGIVITTQDGKVKLTRTDGGWVVSDRGNYAANFSSVQELLVNVLEMEPVQKPKAGASNLGRLQLVDPEKTENADESATRVVFEISGSPTTTLFLGKEHTRQAQGGGPMGGGSYPDGRYVMVGDDLDSLSLVQQTFASVNSDPIGWLNKDFFKVEKIKAIQYRPLEATNAWSVTREDDTKDFAFDGAKEDETLDTTKASGLKFLLSSPSFVDVAVGQSAADTGLDKPVTASIETFEGFKYVVSLGKKDEKDQYFLKFSVDAKIEKTRTPGEGEKPEDKAKRDTEHKEKVEKLAEKLAAEKKLAGNVYIVSKFTVDALLKDRKDLLKTETADAGAPGASIPGVPRMLSPSALGNAGGGLPAGLPPGIDMEAIRKQFEAQMKGAAGKATNDSKKAANKVTTDAKKAVDATDAKIKKEVNELLKNQTGLPPLPKDIAPKATAPTIVPPKVAPPKVAPPKAGEADKK